MTIWPFLIIAFLVLSIGCVVTFTLGAAGYLDSVQVQSNSQVPALIPLGPILLVVIASISIIAVCVFVRR
jgi:hypothetical protein